MKAILISLVCLIISNYGISQTSPDISSRQVIPIEVPTNLERYNVDYKLMDSTLLNGNWDLIDQVDLNYLDSFRSQSTSVQATDPITGFEIILFHEKRESYSPSENIEK